MIMFGSFLPGLLVGWHHQSLLGSREPTLSWNQLHQQSVNRPRKRPSVPVLISGIPSNFPAIFLPLRCELVTCAVHRQKMYRRRRLSLQVLAQLQNVIVHSAGRRIVLEAPDFSQELLPRDNTLCVLQHELQGLKFLSGKWNEF